MASVEEPRRERPPLWPSLLIAAIAGICLPLRWISRHHSGWFDFTILLAPIYIALAFGDIWPVLVGLQAVAFASARRPRLWRYRVAVVVFLVSVGCSVPVVKMELYEIRAKRAEDARMAEWYKQLGAEESAARHAIAVNGVLAFTEPLQGAQAGVLVRYMYEHALTPENLQRMGEHYQDPMVMDALAQKKNCPPEALRILFAKAMNERKTATPVAWQSLNQALDHIGRNANTPADVLVKMAESDDRAARSAALANPNLPKAEKISYLNGACDFHEAEMRYAAQDPDTPPEVLECLSTKPGGALAVAQNPHTPIRVLETLTRSDQDLIKKAAQANLASREAPPQ
ncbi:MAG: hypothetical protein WBD25_21670 [Terriglobales bacterium]|jgi:hypothetical protein